jgi:MFS family permease
LSRPGALVAGCAGGFAVSWNIANTGALATTLADHYGVATGVIGLFAAATFLAELVEMLPAGRAIDRFGAKRSMLVAVVLTIVGNLAAMAGGGIVLALWWRFVTGLGVGLGFIAGSIYIRSDAHGHTTARQGIYGGASLSGGGLALGIVPLFDGAFDWRAPYITAVYIGLAGLLVVALGPPTAPVRHPQVVSSRELLRDRMIARFGVIHAVSFGFSVIIGNWVVTLLERNAGYTRAAAGAVGALTLLSGIVGRPLGGWIAHHGGATSRRLVIVAVLGGGAATALLTATITPALDVLASVGIGLCAGLPFGVNVTGAARAQPTAPGAAVAVMNIYPVAAIVVGAPLVGITFLGGHGGQAGFIAVAVLWAAAALAVPRARALEA